MIRSSVVFYNRTRVGRFINVKKSCLFEDNLSLNDEKESLTVTQSRNTNINIVCDFTCPEFVS